MPDHLRMQCQERLLHVSATMWHHLKFIPCVPIRGFVNVEACGGSAQVTMMAAANEDLERRLAAGPGEAATAQLVAVHDEVRDMRRRLLLTLCSMSSRPVSAGCPSLGSA